MSYETKCKSCGASIVMVEQASGKWMPMDRAQPCGDCNGLGAIKVGGSTVNGVVQTEPTAVRCEPCKGAGVIAVTHFATCPNAAQHRKPKKR